MILYNVTVKVEKEIERDWLDWMQQVHIPDVMQTGLFSEYRLNRILHEEPDGATFAIQYLCANLEAFQQYQREHAQRLQKEHAQRYENRYVAFRTLMEVIQQDKHDQ